MTGKLAGAADFKTILFFLWHINGDSLKGWPMPLIREIKALAKEMTAWRQHLHAHPELSMKEHNTADFLEKTLKSFGLKVERLGSTGVVATLKGKTDTSQKSIMLRSDTDALPITEETNLPYASENPGVMHACGHDGHMAMLLGAAKHLSEHNDFDGTVHFLFQPGEETAEGAPHMLAEGLLEKFPADEIYGLHNIPNVPLGIMGTRKGDMLSAADGFTVTFCGKGGHAAHPHMANDLLYAAAKSVTALKDHYKLRVVPGDKAVLTVSTLHTASNATNVMSETVTISGTFRCYNHMTHLMLKNFLEKTVQNAAHDAGGIAKIEYECSFPALKNTRLQTSTAIQAARQVVNPLLAIPFVPRTTGSDDFAYLSQQRPGNYMAMGTGTIAGALGLKKVHGLHSPKFDFNDAALTTGASYWVKLAQHALKPQSQKRHNFTSSRSH
jgi:hippurate hydrolase